MRILRSSIFALMLSAASAATLAAPAHAQVSINVRVNIPPPPLPYYEQPVIPTAGFLWVPGFWAWDQVEGDYYWVPGTWVRPPRRGLLWTPAYWGWVEGHYVFNRGYWAPRVGFYGGINYGYGYTGEGYLGGRWDRGVFFYNRSVNNVESVRVTNIYNQTVVVNNNTTNVSFNGGNGGTAVRPTPQQETIAKERVEATPLQQQQVQTASKDRALFSKQNNGEPPIAATPQAGVFKGAGVSRGSRTPVATKSNNEPAPNAERPGTGVNKEKFPSKAGEQLKGDERPQSSQQAPEAQPRANQKEAPKAQDQKDAPKAQEPRRPAQEPSKIEEQRRPQERPRTEERRAPPQEPKAEEQRRPVQEPRVQEQRRPSQEPRTQEQRRPSQQPPRAEEQRQPAQATRPEMQQAPRTERPAAAPGGRPGAEERKQE